MTDLLGTHASGADIHRITIGNDRLSVDILTLGAILASVRLDNGPNMTVPPRDLFDRPGDEALIGPIVGPVVNRLTMPVTLDGRDLDLTPVTEDGFVLHSGDGGTFDRVWDICDADTEALTLAIDLPDGLGGFPGNRRITARWSVEDTALHLQITATTDADTLMNIAHHPYWALDGAGPGWDGHQMASPARRYTPSTEVATPTGDIVPVAGSDYDFTDLSPPAAGLDANLCLDDGATDAPRPAATLISPGGRRLDVLTTAPGLQVFSGKEYGIALEPQLWPNAPAHPTFPSILLPKGETFRQDTIYRFSTL